jgi:ferric-dicitrate binding protein FerR (iron transport regulator)
MMDPQFQRWVFDPDEQVVQEWEQWVAEHPEKEREVQEARRLLSAIKFKEYHPPVSTYSRIKSRIHESLHPQAKPYRYTSTIAQRPLAIRTWQKAAVFALLAVVSSFIIYWINYENNTVIQAGYGELRSVTLPDNSVVSLNSNSRIEFAKKWKANTDREVWLQGEAYFHVQNIAPEAAKQHSDAGAKFIVHTGELDVVVTGTEFNVHARREKTQVVLDEGEVHITAIKNAQTPSDEMITMEPGELIEYTAHNDNLVKKVVNPGEYSSWMDRLFVFNNTPLNEVFQRIEDTYGLEVHPNSYRIQQLTFTAKVPSEDVRDLLTLLSETFQLKIRKYDTYITVEM